MLANPRNVTVSYTLFLLYANHVAALATTCSDAYKLAISSSHIPAHHRCIIASLVSSSAKTVSRKLLTRSSFPRVPTTQCPHSNTRTFSVQTRKAKKKAAKAHALTDPPSAFLKTGPPTPKEEAYDVSGLEKEVLKAIEELTHKLSQLRSGGRLNPEVVEGLKVHLGIAGKDGDGKETVRLGDIAQVVPRGRMLNVICGEAEVCQLMSRHYRRGTDSTHSTSNQFPQR